MRSTIKRRCELRPRGGKSPKSRKLRARPPRGSELTSKEGQPFSMRVIAKLQQLPSGFAPWPPAITRYHDVTSVTDRTRSFLSH